MTERTDRRVKYTKALLKNALVEMINQQHISRISIKELCEVADVHRSTFYTHYTDQYDLLHQLEQEVFDNIKKYLEDQGFDDRLPVSVQKMNRILEYAKANAALLRALLSENCDDAFQKKIMEFIGIVNLPYEKKIDEKTQEYISLFGITGCISVLKKWLDEGTPESTEEISELVLQILYKGITSF